jgi:hypothetical protein
MKSFSIDRDNHTTALAGSKHTENAFHSEAELHKLTAEWPVSRLLEIWNSIPGFRPVKMFTDRKTAVARIWKAIQNLQGSVGAQATESRRARQSLRAEAAKPPKCWACSATPGAPPCSNSCRQPAGRRIRFADLSAAPLAKSCLSRSPPPRGKTAYAAIRSRGERTLRPYPRRRRLVPAAVSS